MREIKVGSDFSGVGAFDYAIQRVAEAKGFKVNTVYACDWDKYARISYIENHGEPPYYPKDVYEREIPSESLDIYMTSPPCQAFSLAGKRLGKEDKRGILFFNSHEFIQKNKPRFFIFENVKGLLSDDGGKTFSEWINMLGGKSVNGLPVLFPYEDSVPYHVYWQVLNAKEHGIPQNRNRVFIIGIRDDSDNNFRFPKTEHLKNKLFDVINLNDPIDEKYFLKPGFAEYLRKHKIEEKEKGNGFGFINAFDVDYTSAILTKYGSRGCDTFLDFDSIKHCRYGMNSCSNFKFNLCDDCEGGDNYENFDESKTNTIHSGIRKFTPRECFRLMDFPESFKFVVPDSQLYKQAGNSIVVRVLEKILLNLEL